MAKSESLEVTILDNMKNSLGLSMEASLLAEAISGIPRLSAETLAHGLQRIGCVCSPGLLSAVWKRTVQAEQRKDPDGPGAPRRSTTPLPNRTRQCFPDGLGGTYAAQRGTKAPPTPNAEKRPASADPGKGVLVLKNASAKQSSQS